MKYLLVLDMCSVATGQCPSSSISGWQFNSHYDCVNAGYGVAQKTFQNLAELEGIVTKLERGDVALEEALAEFQKGMVLSKDLQKTLAEAEKTLVKVMQADGSEVELG